MDSSKSEVERDSILIVDDNEVNRRVLSRMLQKKGYWVETACNGKVAVEICERQHFFAVLMDIQMPVMSGYEAAVEIRALDKLAGIHTPIIAITATYLEEVETNAAQCGIDSVLAKPVRYERLFEILDGLPQGHDVAQNLCSQSGRNLR